MTDGIPFDFYFLVNERSGGTQGTKTHELLSRMNPKVHSFLLQKLDSIQDQSNQSPDHKDLPLTNTITTKDLVCAPIPSATLDVSIPTTDPIFHTSLGKVKLLDLSMIDSEILQQESNCKDKLHDSVSTNEISTSSLSNATSNSSPSSGSNLEIKSVPQTIPLRLQYNDSPDSFPTHESQCTFQALKKSLSTAINNTCTSDTNLLSDMERAMRLLDAFITANLVDKPTATQIERKTIEGIQSPPTNPFNTHNKRHSPKYPTIDPSHVIYREPPNIYSTRFTLPICIVSAGGDGTFSWTVSTLCRLGLSPHFEKPPLLPLAALPLGTGNELSRCSGWGIGFKPSRDSISKLLVRLAFAKVTTLDWWTVEIKDISVIEKKDTSCEGMNVNRELHADENPRLMNAEPVATSDRNLRTVDMFCFFSIGFDANIAHKFHLLRQRNPVMCSSVVGNKALHTYYGARQIFVPERQVHDVLDLRVDGIQVQIPIGVRTIQILNIHSSADGTDFFGLRNRGSTSKDSLRNYHIPRPGDGLLEIVGTEGVPHFLKIRAGLGKAFRIAQGREIEILYRNADIPICMQLDGDPWVQTQCQIRIHHRGTVPLLLGPKRLSGGFENV